MKQSNAIIQFGTSIVVASTTSIFSQVENGDLNWVVDGKFLAFAGPHRRSEMTKEGYRTLTPANYIPYFKRHNVTLVVSEQRYAHDIKYVITTSGGCLLRRTGCIISDLDILGKFHL